MDRRQFVREASATAAAAMLLAQQYPARAAGPNDKITIAMVGVKGRGNSVLTTFASRPNVTVKYVCDLDESILRSRTEGVASATGRKPEMIADFRRALDDKSVDAIALGTPDHWHAIPSIMACQAGKDVYVEKPDGHNIIEGRTMVQAAKKHQRVVQLGTQSRSGRHFLDAMDYLKTGAIGRPLFAKAWESGMQKGLGKPADGEPPAGVDYDFWLGPAPKRPFNPLRFHGNWRWFFDYGSGDLGNDGVHRLDVARWAFDTALAAAGQPVLGPVQQVASLGAKCYFDDLQEWPDNLMVTYHFGGGRLLTYEMRIWSPYPLDGEPEGAAVFGDKGYVILGNNGWRAYGPKGVELVKKTGSYGNDVPHVDNFLECMQTRKKPNADLETVGHPSSMLCHLGNVAWRLGRTLKFDGDKYEFVGDAEANQYLTRPEYRKPWTLPVV